MLLSLPPPHFLAEKFLKVTFYVEAEGEVKCFFHYLLSSRDLKKCHFRLSILPPLLFFHFILVVGWLVTCTLCSCFVTSKFVYKRCDLLRKNSVVKSPTFLVLCILQRSNRTFLQYLSTYFTMQYFLDSAKKVLHWAKIVLWKNIFIHQSFYAVAIFHLL